MSADELFLWGAASAMVLPGQAEKYDGIYIIKTAVPPYELMFI